MRIENQFFYQSNGLEQSKVGFDPPAAPFVWMHSNLSSCLRIGKNVYLDKKKIIKCKMIYQYFKDFILERSCRMPDTKSLFINSLIWDASGFRVKWDKDPGGSVSRVSPPWRDLIQRNSRSVDGNIYTPHTRRVGWLVDLFYGVSTLSESFNAELNFKQFSLG